MSPTDSANTCTLDSPVEKRKIICHWVGRARYQNRFRAASQLVTNVSYSDSDKPTRNGMFQRVPFRAYQVDLMGCPMICARPVMP